MKNEKIEEKREERRGKGSDNGVTGRNIAGETIKREIEKKEEKSGVTKLAKLLGNARMKLKC